MHILYTVAGVFHQVQSCHEWFIGDFVSCYEWEKYANNVSVSRWKAMTCKNDIGFTNWAHEDYYG